MVTVKSFSFLLIVFSFLVTGVRRYKHPRQPVCQQGGGHTGILKEEPRED